MNYAELFGYVVLDKSGLEILRSNDPPSKWPKEIKDRIRRDNGSKESQEDQEG